jgi:AcrR family transcriptional regulator
MKREQCSLISTIERYRTEHKSTALVSCEDCGMGVREQNRAEVTAKILAAARAEIAARGGVGLSMRAVAREAGLASSAIYRYFPTREALITAMVIESYGNLDGALRGRRTWAELAWATRAWARGAAHEFQLIYGTPIPAYVAPPETIPAAETVASHFFDAGAGREVEVFGTAGLSRQMSGLLRPGVTPSGAAAVLAELAALVGFITLELAGHFVGTADPADELFEHLIARQLNTLGVD